MLYSQLQESCGYFYTKGMSEQTKALTQDIFTVEEYIAQSDMVLRERLTALDALLSEFKEGFLFFYISTLDLDSHVMWKYHDSSHPAGSGSDGNKYSNHIIDRYKRMDAVLGYVRSTLGSRDILYVISDHGFAPFRRQFHLMRWLHKERYLVYKSPVKARLSKLYADIDWQKTLAYGVGFNGLYLNLKGREASGVVDQADYDKLLDRIRRELLDFRDINGQRVFRNVYHHSEIYDGEELANAPDLILGYDEGYGPSDKSVAGTWSEYVLSDRLEGFTGHHFMDYRLVPGVVFSTRALSADKARLEDVTATILKEFGINPAADMTGIPLY